MGRVEIHSDIVHSLILSEGLHVSNVFLLLKEAIL